jgi:CO dehydrogenase maturation factor
MIIGASGKGGTGKTTFLALTLKRLLEGKIDDILVIDADPATNIGELLNVKIEKTLGTEINELRLEIQKGETSPGITKRDLIQLMVHEVVVETPKFDLLAMGALERRGCFCLINTLLTEIVDVLSGNYNIVLMDTPAGLEHIARRTSRDVDVMYILSDASKMGLQSVGRIVDLAKKVDVKFKKMYLIGNRATNLDKIFKAYAERYEIEYAGSIPEDSQIEAYNLLGKSLLELPENSPAYKAAAAIANATLPIDQLIREF